MPVDQGWVTMLDAFDAAVALFEHDHIIALAVHDRRAGRRKRPGPIGQVGHIDRVLGKGGCPAKRCRQSQRRRQ
jgi:hypothetical protein